MAALVLVLGACSHAPATGFSLEKLTFAGAQDEIRMGPTRVWVVLYSDWSERVAHVIELEPSFRLDDDERIETSVLSPGFEILETNTGCSGTLTVAFSGPVIRFDEHTLFADQDGSRISCLDFVTEIQTFVAVSQQPQISATRRPGATPQDPSDPQFLADTLKIDDEDMDGDARPKVEMNLGADNLASCTEMVLPPASCVGALRVLGTVIPAAGDRTDIHLGDPVPHLSVRFDGIVERVDTHARELHLNTGSVVKVVAGTQLLYGSAPPTELFTSLADAQEGVGLGREVEAHGRATIVGTDPLVLWAYELEMEIEHDLPPGAFEPLVDVQGSVASTNSPDSYVNLPFETRLRLTEESTVEGAFPTASAVGSAMRSGHHVYTRARVVVEEIDKPVLVTHAARATFVTDDGAE